MEKLISEIVKENLTFFYESCTHESKFIIEDSIFYKIYFKKKRYIVTLDKSISKKSFSLLLKKYRSTEIIFLYNFF